MSVTLLVLAAGMGNRFGGPKQIEPFGPNGETMMDYAIYDAVEAGFTKVVFIIRHSLEPAFRGAVGRKWEGRIAVGYVFQEMGELPSRIAARSERTKPWGTTHAIWCARECVKEPFACVNADDFYGKSAFRATAEHLTRPAIPGLLPEYCVVGYPVLQTLSEHGGVSRAICELDNEGLLTALTEIKGLEKSGSTARFVNETGTEHILKGNEVVSMNLMGFTPAVFGQLERELTAFLSVQERSQDNSSECLLPRVVGKLLAEKTARMRVLPTCDAWFGVTYGGEKRAATERLDEMVQRGDYPSPIWNGV